MTKQQAGIIIQARTGSLRLPGKMTLPFFEGLNLLELMIRNFNKIAGDIPFVVATTTSVNDDIIIEICRRNKVPFYRGAESDVLSRFTEAAKEFGFETVIRVCADNPFFDLISTLKLVSTIKEEDVDYVGYSLNGIPSIKTHIGLWGEAVKLSGLEKAASLTRESVYREHVTNFVYGNPDLFRVMLIDAPYNLCKRTDLRFTLDTKEDFMLHQEIYSKFAESGAWGDIPALISLVDENQSCKMIMQEQIIKNSK
ncbi:MAG: aminotransferase [Lentimicrobium sp.]|nr:aminotransferase [Lentimicrobium sp.]